ncbi:MAG TPA: Flp pilus assembly protein CpaB [Chloroflexota bacterium]|jgi:Flp pilus assembly protein CpaB
MSRKRGGLILLVLGVVIAVGVASFVFQQAQRAAETARLESVEVLVAAQDIPERTMISAPFLATKRMLPTSLPPAAMVRPEEAVGKMTTGPILAGDFIMPAKLAEADGRAGLAFTLPKGKVVITLPASDILTTGAVRAGDRVDLLVTIKPPDKKSDQPQPAGGADGDKAKGAGPARPAPTPVVEGDLVGDYSATQMTMQNLKVLAIGAVLPAGVTEGDKAKGASQAPTTPQTLITFAVGRQDALTLKALKDAERVKMELVLRGASDEEIAKTDPVTLGTIIDRYQFRAVPTPRAQPEAGR